jgi:hypothetical protein
MVRCRINRVGCLSGYEYSDLLQSPHSGNSPIMVDDYDDDDEDEFEDRPRRRRSSRRNNQGAVKQRKIRPFPALLIVMVSVAFLSGALCIVSSCGQLWMAVDLGINGPQNKNIKVLSILVGILCVVDGICALGLLAGGVVLLLRRAFGRYLVLFSTLGIFVAQAIRLLIAISIVRSLSGPLQFTQIAGLVVIFGLGSFFFTTQQNENVNNALR